MTEERKAVKPAGSRFRAQKSGSPGPRKRARRSAGKNHEAFSIYSRLLVFSGNHCALGPGRVMLMEQSGSLSRASRDFGISYMKAWTLFRYEYFDPNTEIQGNNTTGLITGLNYFIKGDDIKLMANYMLEDVSGEPNWDNKALLRLQVIF